MRLWELTVVLYYHKTMGTYGRIVLPQDYGNLQSYCTTTRLWELTVVLDYGFSCADFTKEGTKGTGLEVSDEDDEQSRR